MRTRGDAARTGLRGSARHESVYATHTVLSFCVENVISLIDHILSSVGPI